MIIILHILKYYFCISLHIGDKDMNESMSSSEEIPIAKVRISITLPKEVVEWLDRRVEERVFATRSHAIEVFILEKMKETGRGH
jgi:hypothetical protein